VFVYEKSKKLIVSKKAADIVLPAAKMIDLPFSYFIGFTR
jgi:hypothetical protein